MKPLPASHPPSTDTWQPATQAVRAGQRRSQEQEHSEALYLTSSFVYDSAADAAAAFAGECPGANIYSRFTNPTVQMFEQRLAVLEGGERAVATASGMAAILAVALAFLKAGDHVVCSRAVFGTSVSFFEKTLSKFGVHTRFVPLDDLSAWQQALQPNTRMLFCETPSNPRAEVVDLRRLAQLARTAGALLVVDNCFCTPILQQPLKLGADLVVHSATKYLDGQGRVLGGAVVGSQALLEEVYGVVRTCGPSMSPFNAWVCLKGLETLKLRMEAHCRSAQALAQWLDAHPAVEQVFYTGLPDHPGHAIAAAQQSGFGGMVSFVVRGGREAAWQVIDATQLLSITGNLGDAKSTITHPATTTHGRLSTEAKQRVGIVEGLIRLSVGLEDLGDIQNDLARGLDAVAARPHLQSI